jgi:methylenetetrahydrofolate dehydrogenase (NADP+)/methenyltetrahydrofolate cyclohydrolase
MPAQLLQGAPVAEKVLEEVAERVGRLRARGLSVGLGTILVGDDAPSAGYVRKKHETAQQVGIDSYNLELPSSASHADLMAAVRSYNEDDAVDAFLIQYPVPDGFDYAVAVAAMAPEKDGDGLHPENLGRLVLQEPGPIPATPAGIREMLLHYGIAIEGREVVVVGRGPTLGRPVALLLSQKAPGANAAVTVVHTGVDDMSVYTKRADIVIAAAGVPGIVTRDMVREGAIVISGGITWKGKRLIPDVDVEVGQVAGWITPRLGGVGPTTVAMLLRNAVTCAELRRSSG